MEVTYNPVLEESILNLDLSDSFKEMAYCHSFKTIKEILHWPVSVLLMHEGFSYHHYQELRNLLRPINAVHLIKTVPSQLV